MLRREAGADVPGELGEGERRGRPVAVPVPGEGDHALGDVDRQQDDPGIGGVHRERRDEGRPDARSHEALHRPVVVGAEGDPWIQAVVAEVGLRHHGAPAGAEADERVLGDLGQRGPGRRSVERRSSGHHQHVRVVEQLDAVERALGQRQDGEGEVELARFDEGEQAQVFVALAELDLDARPARGEAAEQRGHDPGPDALVRADAEDARRTGRIGPQVRLGRRQARRDRVGVSEQEAAGLGQLDLSPTAPALDEPQADDPLEARDVLAHGRRVYSSASAAAWKEPVSAMAARRLALAWL